MRRVNNLPKRLTVKQSEGNIIHADLKDLYEKMLLNGYKE